MKISKINQRFSERLEEPDALTNPAKYLGPNWEDVLNFWFYVEGLSDEEWAKLCTNYWALDSDMRASAAHAAVVAAEEVVGEDFSDDAWFAANDVTGWSVFGWATEELIGHHKLIEQDKTPLALQYCIKS